MRTCQLQIILAALLWVGPCGAEGPSHAQLKTDALNQLQAMRDGTTQRLRDLDGSLRTKITQDSTDETEIENLRVQRAEFVSRQEILNRLIFRVDTRFSGGDLRQFLRTSLKEMALDEVTSVDPLDRGTWKFLKYAAEALGGESEKREDVVAFLLGYMQRSVTHPMNPKVYLANRNYTNGIESQAGQPLRADLAGAIADKRTREAKVQASPKLKAKR